MTGVSRAQLADLSSLFSTAVLRRLADPRPLEDPGRLRSLLKAAAHHLSIGEAFDSAYRLVSRDRGPEYLYKNTVVSKLVLGRHNVHTASAGLEVAMGRSAADVLILNGTSTVYEIKTDLDSFSRLTRQLEDYASVAEHIYLVTSDRRAAAGEAVLPDHVGLLALRRNGKLAICKPSTGGLERLDPIAIHRVLRKAEVLRVVDRTLGATKIPAGRFTDETQRLLGRIPIELLHAEAIAQLRDRFAQASPLVSQQHFPHSLRALAYGTPLSSPRRRTLLARLSLPVTSLGGGHAI